ncbi:MAG: putative signal-transduction protein containing cAMP-binding and domain [Thermoleophilia bacterium]|nr:putative signal-transduction protein containing cAMP-binding and domain [Thermoleophilia bacterium]MCZ4496571.1 putative signal-transduction protein containing cAMP-binding and domain [Thermoleophilia bacterium]
MLVRDILDGIESFPTIVTDVTVREAARVMQESDVRAIPVVENDKLVGIITDWDIVDAFATEGDSLADRPVSAIMTSENLSTINADRTAAEAAGTLRHNRVHHLPVLEDDKYVGVLCLGLEWSEGDMLAPPVRPVLTARRP